MMQWAFAHPYLFAFCGTTVLCVIALACVDATANLVKGAVLLLGRKAVEGSSTKEESSRPDTFFTPPGTPRMTHKEMAKFLFGLLDDIDTVSDMAKGDNQLYRNTVEKIQARRFECGITSDGQRLIFPGEK